MIENTGNLPIYGATLTDPLLGLDHVTCAGISPTSEIPPQGHRLCVPVLVDPITGEQTPAKVSYEITEADVLAGTVNNSATAAVTVPDGFTPPPDSTSDVAEPLAPLADLLLDKAQVGKVIDVNRNGTMDAGDQIVYSFKVTNTGNVSLHDVRIDDPLLGLTGATAFACPDPVDPMLDLAPYAVRECPQQTYTLTQNDVNAGVAENTATALATPPTSTGLPDVESSDRVTTTIDAFASFTLDKHADWVDTNGNGAKDAGDKVSYSFTVTNTGTAVLASVGVDDPQLGLSGFTCPAYQNVAPGAKVTCPAKSYTITADDPWYGTLDNHAQATALPLGAAQPIVTKDATSLPLKPPVRTRIPGQPGNGGTIVIIIGGKGYRCSQGICQTPTTGSDVGSETGFGGLLVLLGAALLFAGKRRRRPEEGVD